MRTIVAWITTGIVGGEKSTEFEVEDNATDEEIDEMAEEAIYEMAESGWFEKEAKDD